MGRLQHKRGRPSKYRKSLKDNPYWDTVKRKVRIRDNFKCICCGATIKLETHHITYKVNGRSITGKELEHLEWMATLCEKHHQEAHSKPDHPLNPSNKNKLNCDQFKNPNS